MTWSGFHQGGIRYRYPKACLVGPNRLPDYSGLFTGRNTILRQQFFRMVASIINYLYWLTKLALIRNGECEAALFRHGSIPYLNP